LPSDVDMILLAVCALSLVILSAAYFYKLKKHQTRRQSMSAVDKESGLIMYINIPQNDNSVIPVAI
jgi:hypothetical protein